MAENVLLRSVFGSITVNYLNVYGHYRGFLVKFIRRGKSQLFNGFLYSIDLQRSIVLAIHGLKFRYCKFFQCFLGCWRQLTQIWLGPKSKFIFNLLKINGLKTVTSACRVSLLLFKPSSLRSEFLNTSKRYFISKSQSPTFESF